MNKEVPGIFEKIDGWASHSYPNHGFLGKPQDSGRTSIRGYQWELAILKSQFGVKKELPVFITETGWPHQKTQNSNVKAKNFYSPELVAEYIETAYKNVWLPDKKVVAVTPFTLSYQAEPLDVFSWFDNQGQPYSQYERVKNLPKNAWWPQQEEKWEILIIKFPQFMTINSSYRENCSQKYRSVNLGRKRSFCFKIQFSFLYRSFFRQKNSPRPKRRAVFHNFKRG